MADRRKLLEVWMFFAMFFGSIALWGHLMPLWLTTALVCALATWAMWIVRKSDDFDQIGERDV